MIRFKKLDRNGQSRSYLTPSQRRWFEDKARLPEMPPEAVRLVAGYVLDEISANLARVLVTKPRGHSGVMWCIELAEGGSVKVVEMPRLPMEPKAPVVRSKKRKPQSNDPSRN